MCILARSFLRYNGKRSDTTVLARDFFVRQFKGLAANMNIGKRALGCITEKDPSKKSKRQRTDFNNRSNLYLLRFIEKTYASFLTTSLPL